MKEIDVKIYVSFMTFPVEKQSNVCYLGSL